MCTCDVCGVRCVVTACDVCGVRCVVTACVHVMSVV